MSRSGRRGASTFGTVDVLLLIAALSLPWWFGGVGIGAMRAAAACVSAAAGIAIARRGLRRGLGLDRDAVWLVPAFALAAFAFVQATPMPRGVVRAVSPRAATIQERAFGPATPGADAWLRRLEIEARREVPEAAQATPAAPLALPAGEPGAPPWFRLSLSPDQTIERAFWFCALLLAFLVVRARAAEPGRAAVYRTSVLAFAVVLAVTGIANHLTSPDSLLWLTAAPGTTRPMGPYVNPSHFAGVMELTAPWMLGYGLATFARRRGSAKPAPKRVLALIGAGVAVVAAVVAASKTAVVTIGLSAVVLVAVAARRGRHVRALLAGAAALALLLAAVALAGPLRGRVTDFLAVYQGQMTEMDRAAVWRLGGELVRDYPVVGSGFGAFRDVIPPYLPRGESEHWLQMHNDYLEVAAGGGLVAMLLIAWLAVGFAARLARRVRAGNSADDVLTSLGLTLGVASLAVHEVVDFNLQIPANALLFVVVAACGIAAPADNGEAA